MFSDVIYIISLWNCGKKNQVITGNHMLVCNGSIPIIQQISYRTVDNLQRAYLIVILPSYQILITPKAFLSKYLLEQVHFFIHFFQAFISFLLSSLSIHWSKAEFPWKYISIHYCVAKFQSSLLNKGAIILLQRQ